MAEGRRREGIAKSPPETNRLPDEQNHTNSFPREPETARNSEKEPDRQNQRDSACCKNVGFGLTQEQVHRRKWLHKGRTVVIVLSDPSPELLDLLETRTPL